MRFSFLLAIVASLPLCLSPAAAQEWTRFHGPNGSGESEASTIPAAWTEKDINWKVKLPGIGHASPVLWGDKIFVFSADPQTATRYVQCISAGDGSEIWTREYPGVKHHLHTNSSFASATPAVDAERVYLAWSDPEFTRLMALDHAGHEQWTINLGPWVSQHGFGSSPMLYGDLVVVHCSQEDSQGTDPRQPRESFIVAVDRSTGDIRWKTPRKIVSASYSVPCVRKNEAGQDELVCSSQAEGIFALDPKTGRELWSVPTAFTMRTVSSPLLVNGLIFGSTGKGAGGHYVVAVRPGQRPEVEYEIRRDAPYVPTSVARGHLLFLFEDRLGHVSCVDTTSGEIVWSQPRVGKAFFGSPVRAGDKLFCVDTDGVVICLAAEDEFKELGRTPLGELCRSTPAIAGGRMYVRTVGHLISVGGPAARE